MQARCLRTPGVSCFLSSGWYVLFFCEQAVLPKRMEIEDATPEKPPHEMTDDELNAVLWKQYKELGVTEQDVADASTRREAACSKANSTCHREC